MTFSIPHRILNFVNRTGELVDQAEREFRTSTRIPDLDNANVGTLYSKRLWKMPWYLPFLFHRNDLHETKCSLWIALCESAKDWHLDLHYNMNKEMIEIEREFMKGCTTTGVLLCELFFHFRKGVHMVTINGKNVDVKQPLTVAQYLEENHYQISRIAVELNYEILPKADYAATVLKDGDILEIVSFVGGG